MLYRQSERTEETAYGTVSAGGSDHLHPRSPGEVKVFPTTDDLNRFKDLKEVFLDTGKGRILMEIEQVKFFKNMVILKFKGYDNINEIEMYQRKGSLDFQGPGGQSRSG